jgi:hypothetical protein
MVRDCEGEVDRVLKGFLIKIEGATYKCKQRRRDFEFRFKDEVWL